MLANSSRNVAKILSLLTQQLEGMHLHIKEGSQVIVPSSCRRLQWPSLRCGHQTFTGVDESKVLGYYVACNGDTSRSRSTLNGALRGRLATMDKRFALAPAGARAYWWRQQCRGFIGFFAAFLGINVTIIRQMGIIANLGARKICNLGRRFNVHDQLMQIRTDFNIDTELFYVQTVVRWLGHCFQHPPTNFFTFKSSP